MPPGYPEWAGESSMSEYMDKHFPKREGETDEQWIYRHIKRCKDEPDVDYLLRVAEDPVWVTSLRQWKPFPFVIERPRFGSNDRIKADVPNLKAGQEFFKRLGKVMDAKIAALKEMGWLQEQRMESDGRYGSGYLPKNIVHCLLQKCGVLSNMTIFMPGESFYHTNTVMPYAARRGLAGIYNPGAVGFWTGLVSSRKHRVGFMAIGENQLCMEPVTRTTTEGTDRRNRWERYNFALHAYVGSDGVLSIRGWLGSQEYVQKAELRDVEVDIDVATESEEVVNVDGRDRKVVFKGKVARSKKIPMYVLPLGKLRPTIDLLRALQGFNEASLLPFNSKEKD